MILMRGCVIRSAPVSPTHYSSGMYTPGEMSREGSDGEEESSSPGSRQQLVTSSADSSAASQQQVSSVSAGAAALLNPAQSRLLQLHGAAAVRTIQSAPGSPQGECSISL